MLVSTFITRVSHSLRGTDDNAPVTGSDDYTYWLDTANRKKDELYEDVTKLWRLAHKSTPPNETGTVATAGTTTLTGTSTFFTDYAVGDKITVSGETVRTIATIPSDTSLTVTVAFSNTATAKTFTRTTIISTGLEYSLHRSFLAPSDRVYVLETTSNKTYLDLKPPQENDYQNQSVFISGDKPQVLTFTESFVANSSMLGGSLYIPGYYMPSDMTADTDDVPISDPNWLVLATAAEIAFNDIVYEDKAEGLNTKANNLFSQMVKKNRGGTFNTPRITPTNLKRIRDTRIV